MGSAAWGPDTSELEFDAEVEEWLPGGVPERATRTAEVDPAAEFMIEVRDQSRRGDGTAATDTIDLNRIDFEGLVARGISVGQAARFISQRERRGGISSLHEVDAFYGLSPGVRDILRWSGHV